MSIDNALALACIVRRLPERKQQKALFIGIVSSIVLRAIGVISAAYFIQLFFVQLIGGLYLIYLSLSHLWPRALTKHRFDTHWSFWKTVVMIELTDCIFAIDSILAGLAMIGGVFHPPNLPPKIWIVYVGGILGLVLMRFIAKIFTGFIARFPKLERCGHLIVGWIGLKLLLGVWMKEAPLWGESIFWIGIIFFFFYRLFKPK